MFLHITMETKNTEKKKMKKRTALGVFIYWILIGFFFLTQRCSYLGTHCSTCATAVSSNCTRFTETATTIIFCNKISLLRKSIMMATCANPILLLLNPAARRLRLVPRYEHRYVKQKRIRINVPG